MYLGFSCCFRVAMMDSDLYWDGQQGTCVEAAVKGAVNRVWSQQCQVSTCSLSRSSEGWRPLSTFCDRGSSIL